MLPDIAMRIRDLSAVHVGLLSDPVQELEFLRSVSREVWSRQPEVTHRAILAGADLDRVTVAFGRPATEIAHHWSVLARWSQKPDAFSRDVRLDWSPRDIETVARELGVDLSTLDLQSLNPLPGNVNSVTAASSRNHPWKRLFQGMEVIFRAVACGATSRHEKVNRLSGPDRYEGVIRNEVCPVRFVKGV